MIRTMEALIEFSIPIKGLKPGVHQYGFQIGSEFFENFEHSLIDHGDVKVDLSLDKRPDFYVLDFRLAGTVKTECDRCLSGIDLPIASDQQLLVKFGAEDSKEEAEVIYITPETQKLNVAQYIYEFVCLAIPMVKIYDCTGEPNPPCNQEMLDFLEPNDPIEESSNPIWDALKNFKDNHKS